MKSSQLFLKKVDLCLFLYQIIKIVHKTTGLFIWIMYGWICVFLTKGISIHERRCVNSASFGQKTTATLSIGTNNWLLPPSTGGSVVTTHQSGLHNIAKAKGKDKWEKKLFYNDNWKKTKCTFTFLYIYLFLFRLTHFHILTDLLLMFALPWFHTSALSHCTFINSPP